MVHLVVEVLAFVPTGAVGWCPSEVYCGPIHALRHVTCHWSLFSCLAPSTMIQFGVWSRIIPLNDRSILNQRLYLYILSDREVIRVEARVCCLIEYTLWKLITLSTFNHWKYVLSSWVHNICGVSSILVDNFKEFIVIHRPWVIFTTLNLFKLFTTLRHWFIPPMVLIIKLPTRTLSVQH